ncbi:DrmB family protein [Mycolicibacterium sp. HS_4_1]
MTEQIAAGGVVDDAQPVAVGAETLDPIADAEAKTSKNYARVGSIRPSAMLYTNGIGATVDLPHFAVMPSGLDAWERVYARRPGGADMIAEPRLLELTQGHLGAQVVELRKPPWAPEEKGWSAGSAIDLGIPSRIFPQWLRCTGCGLLAPVSHERFVYRNVVKYRPDRAEFIHDKCKGFEGKKKAFKAVALPARYLIACVNGHLDEFPYDAWVHRGTSCSSGSAFPPLRMREWKSNIGPDVQIHCLACQQSRGMLEAVGPKAAEKLPMCRGRHPHLDAFYKCGQRGRLMMLGAANQWFASTLGLLALPREEIATAADLVPLLRILSKSDLDDPQSVADVKMWRKYAAMATKSEAFDEVADEIVWEAVQIARGSVAAKADGAPEPPSDPRAILAPEWAVLTDEAKYTRLSGSRDFRALRRDVPMPLQPTLSAVVAVERLKKVNAFLGFTRIDALDRIDDAASRVAPLCANGRPTWVPAAEDRGEGVFLQFDESIVAAWEQRVLGLPVWEAFRQAHRLNFRRRTSKTADAIDPDSRFPAPRYWAIHSLSHLLIREAAMSSGYGSASLTERIYAWPAGGDYEPAAGLLISTTASDGEGTLGGLVELARPAKLERLFRDAIRRGQRCSSDPICSHRAPRGKEEFLHGAACHFCLFLSETSCERTNRFLDRRLLLGLLTDPDVQTPGLFEGLSILG